MSDYKRAFVLMPFREPIGSYYPAIFKPALEAVGYNVTRADDLFTPQPVMQDIRDSILAADLILCEMSDRNPNVFYELGLAHAIGKPAILISRKADDIPFDLRHVRVILYDSTEAGWENKLQEDIGVAAQAVVTSTEIWPPSLIDVSPMPHMNIPVQQQELAGVGNNPVVTDSHLAGVLRTAMNEDLENVQRSYSIKQDGIDWSGTKRTIGSKFVEFKFLLTSASTWTTELMEGVTGKLFRIRFIPRGPAQLVCYAR